MKKTPTKPKPTKREQREAARIIKAVRREHRVLYRMYADAERILAFIEHCFLTRRYPEIHADMRSARRGLKQLQSDIRSAVGRSTYGNFRVRYLFTKSARC